MGKTAVVIVRNAAEHHTSWGGAFAEGLRRHGWTVHVSTSPAPCDLMVLWGVRRGEWISAQTRKGGEVCVLERGYLGDRFKWASVSFGGELNGRAEFRTPPHDGARFRLHFPGMLKPWRAPGPGYLLLMGQVPGDMSLRGVDIAQWYARTARAAAAAGWDVRFRPHPAALERGYRAPVPNAKTVPPGEIAEALAGAAAVVTYNSNSAVDAVLAGVPTVAVDRGSMAWDVTARGLDALVTPDRAEWVHRLAWCQFSRQEMRLGECWEAVGGCNAVRAA